MRVFLDDYCPTYSQSVSIGIYRMVFDTRVSKGQQEKEEGEKKKKEKENNLDIE